MENSNVHQIDLSRLAAVLESALHATTKTKIVLHKSCDVAQHLLSNWPIPVAAVHEQPLHCACNGNDEDSEVTEVARNIDQAVKQAQKLRETLSVSQLQPNCPRLTKRSNVEKISSELEFDSKKLNHKVQNRTQSAKFSCVNTPQSSGFGPSSSVKRLINKRCVAQRSLLNSYSPRATLTNTNQQAIPVPIMNGNYAKKAVPNHRFKSSASLQTTYQKDFSVRTNCNVAKHSIATRSGLKPKRSVVTGENTTTLCSTNKDSVNVNMDRDPKKSNGTSFPEETGISDLEDLLSRVTAYCNVTADSGIKNKIPELKVNSFLSHGDKTADITEEAYRLVGLAEAVDKLGVPSDLVMVLKTYHRFLAGNQEGKKNRYHTGKRQAAAERFLTKASAMNNASWQQLAHEPLVGLFSEYMTLVSEVSSVVECKFKDIKDDLACLQQKLELLERTHHKLSNVDESIFTQPKTRNHKGIIEENNEHRTSQHDGYAMIGVWNPNSTWRFKALTEMQCIRYSREAQWKKLEANVQEIQMLEFQTEVFQVLESFILPQLISYDVQDPTFPKLYKTVCSLCNMTLLTSPIIIKSF